MDNWIFCRKMLYVHVCAHLEPHLLASFLIVQATELVDSLRSHVFDWSEHIFHIPCIAYHLRYKLSSHISKLRCVKFEV